MLSWVEYEKMFYNLEATSQKLKKSVEKGTLMIMNL